MSVIFALEIHSGSADDSMQTLFNARSPGVVSMRFDDFGSQMVQELAPRSVLTPLFSDKFDCIDVANCLARARFAGTFCVVAEQLPNAAMVQNELKRQFPSLDLRVITHGDALGAVIPEPRQAIG